MRGCFIIKAIERFAYANDLREHFFPAYKQVSPEQLEWKTDGYKNNIGFLLRHIAQSEDWFLQAVIKREAMTPRRKAGLQTIDQLLAYLDETRENTLKFLKANPIDVLNETRTIPEGFRGKPINEPSVGWIIHRVFDHEVYHLGQINILLRLQGVDPPNM